jgi:hypothetical protein
MVRKGGLEPPCLSAPPPQDGVSANFTTSALRTKYGTVLTMRIGAAIRHPDVIVPGYRLQTGQTGSPSMGMKSTLYGKTLARLRRCHLGGGSGDAENDPCAFAWLANNFHFAAVKQHDALHDRQPEARAARGL